MVSRNSGFLTGGNLRHTMAARKLGSQVRKVRGWVIVIGVRD